MNKERLLNNINRLWRVGGIFFIVAGGCTLDTSPTLEPTQALTPTQTIEPQPNPTPEQCTFHTFKADEKYQEQIGNSTLFWELTSLGVDEQGNEVAGILGVEKRLRVEEDIIRHVGTEEEGAWLRLGQLTKIDRQNLSIQVCMLETPQVVEKPNWAK